MVRKFLYAAAFAASLVAGAVTPAAAQSRGSVTLSIGSPGYGYYDNRYDNRFYGYRDRHDDWRARERWERRLRWERERAWRARAWRERRFYRDRDWHHDRDWRRYGY